MSDLLSTIKAIQRHVGVDADGSFGPMTASAVLGELVKASNIEHDSTVILDSSGLDERTLKSIATLDPKARDEFTHFAQLAKATAATFGCDYVMLSGLRTWEEQDALYNKGGVTKARGGYSWHNYGVAGDFGVFKGKVYLDDSTPENQRLAEKVHAACSLVASQAGLAWGGSWKTFKDTPHFQLDSLPASPTATHRSLYKQKGSVL